MSLENIPFSILTVQERWIKLYRSLFHNFLKKDFVELEDFKMMHMELNGRITQLESALNSNISTTNAAIKAAIAGHLHNAPQAPAGMIPTGPGLPQSPLQMPSPAKIPETPFYDTVMKAKDRAYLGLGPAMAPLGDGLSPEAAIASSKAVSNIGFV